MLHKKKNRIGQDVTYPFVTFVFVVGRRCFRREAEGKFVLTQFVLVSLFLFVFRDKNEIEQKLRNFKLNHPNVQFVRILLAGDVGAGKSSFINSVNNVFQKRITAEALTNSSAGHSFTKTVSILEFLTDNLLSTSPLMIMTCSVVTPN